MAATAASSPASPRFHISGATILIYVALLIGAFFMLGARSGAAIGRMTDDP